MYSTTIPDFKGLLLVVLKKDYFYCIEMGIFSVFPLPTLVNIGWPAMFDISYLKNNWNHSSKKMGLQRVAWYSRKMNQMSCQLIVLCFIANIRWVNKGDVKLRNHLQHDVVGLVLELTARCGTCFSGNVLSRLETLMQDMGHLTARSTSSTPGVTRSVANDQHKLYGFTLLAFTPHKVTSKGWNRTEQFVVCRIRMGHFFCRNYLHCFDPEEVPTCNLSGKAEETIPQLLLWLDLSAQHFFPQSQHGVTVISQCYLN